MILDLQTQGGLYSQLTLLLKLFVMKNYLWKLLMITGGRLQGKTVKNMKMGKKDSEGFLLEQWAPANEYLIVKGFLITSAIFILYRDKS